MKKISLLFVLLAVMLSYKPLYADSIYIGGSILLDDYRSGNSLSLYYRSDYPVYNRYYPGRYTYYNPYRYRGYNHRVVPNYHRYYNNRYNSYNHCNRYNHHNNKYDNRGYKNNHKGKR